MKIFDQCCQEVAKKHGLGKTLVTGHRVVYFTEAANLYANEKLKGLLDEVNLFAQVFEQKSESAEDEGQGCHLSGRAAVYREIATRIEEMIEELNKTPGHVRS